MSAADNADTKLDAAKQRVKSTLAKENELAFAEAKSLIQRAREISNFSSQVDAACNELASNFSSATDADYGAVIKTAHERLFTLLNASNEDRRAAVQITADLPKVFITMSLAVIVALGTLFQLGWSTFIRDNQIVVLLCILSGVASFFSAYFGLRALRELAYSGFRDRGRWIIDNSIRRLLNFQAIIGAFSVISFVASIVLAQTSSPGGGGGVIITIPGGLTATVPNEITFRGSWSKLSAENSNGTKLELPAQLSGPQQSFTVRSGK
ncbi:hypothetical protein [Cupriavidus lacunae]|uniref:hypothetical protein n=1 Tax=Cupriavidus lacunae TaxID=2666307 RepID=UPI001058F677|nr:hypothetical protein [Cupriavidus lacunae]